MNQDGQGKGKLVPTGKHEPTFDVTYDISHEVAKVKTIYGEPTKRVKAVVHYIASNNGQAIPPGDFDLLVGSEILRLKHLPSDPEWLVLSWAA